LSTIGNPTRPTNDRDAVRAQEVLHLRLVAERCRDLEARAFDAERVPYAREGLLQVLEHPDHAMRAPELRLRAADAGRDLARVERVPDREHSVEHRVARRLDDDPDQPDPSQPLDRAHEPKGGLEGVWRDEIDGTQSQLLPGGALATRPCPGGPAGAHAAERTTGAGGSRAERAE
jgi:hypothetical protein